jgi:hypothetical protein
MQEIKYKDFIPVVKEKSFWGGEDYETTAELMPKVNKWRRENPNLKILNIETIQKHHKLYNKRKDDIIFLSGLDSVYIYPIIRVWFE